VRKLSDDKFKKVNAYKYGNYVISLTGMLNDKVYRKQILELYNLIKVAVNVPHVIFNNQHYVGYIKTADL
jgi:hypothetical protein